MIFFIFIFTFLKKYNLLGLPARHTPYNAQYKLTSVITDEDIEFMKEKQKSITFLEFKRDTFLGVKMILRD